MAGFKLANFQGRYPGVDPRSLPATAATIATDVKLGYGDVRPLNGYADQNYELVPHYIGPPRSLFKYLDAFWLHFEMAASWVTAPIGQDAFARLICSIDEYQTDEAPALRVYGLVPPDNVANNATNGDGPYPSGPHHALGVAVPAAATTATKIAGDLGDVEDQRSFAYCHTYVNGRGEEGAPSVPSDIVVVNEGLGFTNRLTAVNPNGTPSGRAADGTAYLDATSVRFYRLYAEDTTATWMFLAEVPIATPTFDDSYKTEELPGDVLETLEWLPPIVGIKGIRALPNGAVVGFKGNQLIFSEPWYPYAWPTRYRYTTDTEIVGIGVFGSTIAILTKAQPYLAQGVSPGEMTLSRMDGDQACISARSIVDFGDRVVWASTEGLFAIGANGPQPVTTSFMDKNTWKALYSPDSIHAYAYEGRYIAFYGGAEGAGFVVDPFAPEDGLVDLSVYAYAGHRDMLSNALYLALYDGIEDKYRLYSFDADVDNPHQYEWRSKPLEFPSHVSPSRAQVIAREFPHELDLTYINDAGGEVVKAVGLSVPTRNQITLPGGALSTEWMVTIRSLKPATAILFGEGTQLLKQE